MADFRGKLTVVEQVYHQLSGEQPCLVESRFSRELESDEQPYERHLKVDEKGAPLDCGWVKKASQLVITNKEGQDLQLNPTDEEREELACKVLEVFYAEHSEDYWLIPPGESMRGQPSCAPALIVRSRSGVIRFTLHLFPK